MIGNLAGTENINSNTGQKEDGESRNKFPDFMSQRLDGNGEEDGEQKPEKDKVACVGREMGGDFTEISPVARETDGNGFDKTASCHPE